MKRLIQKGALVAAVLAAGASLPLQDLLVAATAKAYALAHRSALQTAQTQLATLDGELAATSRETESNFLLSTVASSDAEQRGFERKQRDTRSIQTAIEAQRGQQLRKVRQLDATSAQLIAETNDALGYPQDRTAVLARKLAESQHELFALQSRFERAEQREQQQRLLKLATQLMESVESINPPSSDSGHDCSSRRLTATPGELPDRVLKIHDTAK